MENATHKLMNEILMPWTIN